MNWNEWRAHVLECLARQMAEREAVKQRLREMAERLLRLAEELQRRQRRETR